MEKEINNQEERLKDLQSLLINEFISRIESGEAAPSDLNAARQLLKDNGIHAALSKDNPMENLVKINEKPMEFIGNHRNALEIRKNKENHRIHINSQKFV